MRDEATELHGAAIPDAPTNGCPRPRSVPDLASPADIGHRRVRAGRATRRGVLLAVAVAAASLLTACGAGETPASEAPEGPEPHDADEDVQQPEGSPREYPDEETAQDGEEERSDMDDPDGDDSGEDPDEQGEPTNGPGTGADSVITEDDDGGTVTLQQGERAALQLDSDWLWEEPRQQGDGVQLTPVSHLVDPGYQEWEVEATSPGATTLRIDGGPNCDDPDACPPRTLEIRIQVEAT